MDKLQAAAATTIQDLPGLPAGVKFDPTDQELLEHLEGKARPDTRKLHPLIDEFIPAIEGENGICYTHPERLPGNTVTSTTRSVDTFKLLALHYIKRLAKASNFRRKRFRIRTSRPRGCARERDC